MFAAAEVVAGGRAVAEAAVESRTLQGAPSIVANCRAVDIADSAQNSVAVVASPVRTVRANSQHSCSSSGAAGWARMTAFDERAKRFESGSWAAAVIDTATGCRCCDSRTREERWRIGDGLSDRREE